MGSKRVEIRLELLVVDAPSLFRYEGGGSFLCIDTISTPSIYGEGADFKDVPPPGDLATEVLSMPTPLRFQVFVVVVDGGGAFAAAAGVGLLRLVGGNPGISAGLYAAARWF